LQKQAGEKQAHCPRDGGKESADAEYSPAQFFCDKLQAKAEVGNILNRVHKANAPGGQSAQPGAGQQDVQGPEESDRPAREQDGPPDPQAFAPEGRKQGTDD
jgi:hypothetical protein